MIWMLSLRKMASKARLTFGSRSRIKNRGGLPRSPRSISRLRACWVIHAESGWRVQAMYSTRRVPIETKNSTYSRRSHTVSTVKKSQAMIVSACWRRNERQLETARLGAGGIPARASTLRTSVCGDGDPELAQFAHDPHVAPVAVLARKPQDQLPHVLVDSRPARPPVRIRPAPRNHPP